MNEPKRLTITNLNWPDKSVKENTEWVSNEDYLLLKAENERIRKLFADTERLMLLDGEYEAAKVGTYASHKAKVERLTSAMEKVISTADKIDEQNQRLIKAGDAMAEICNLHGHIIAIQKWGAAKQSKPTK